MTNENNEIAHDISKMTMWQIIYDIQRELALSIKATATNPFHKSKYIDLYTLMEILMPYLKKYRLLVTHSIGDGVLTTSLVRIDNSEEYAMHAGFDLSKLDAQQMGSYITYLRRYSICCLFGIVADKDDDGNSASGIKHTKLASKTAEPDKEVLSDKEMNSPRLINNMERDMFISHMKPEEVVEKIKTRYVITQLQEDTMLRRLYTQLFEHERELEKRNSKNDGTKKPLSNEEFESPLFTKALDKYLNDDFTPQQILNKMKDKYNLTPDQEATIINLK